MSSSALAVLFKTVITGYNTDIEFDGVVYHVQTEDKGSSTPVIMSLVYDRGTILASKRVSYDDLINGSVDEEAVAERLTRQHKLICAAVGAGRIEDLKQMSARNLKAAAAIRAGSKKKEKTAPKTESVEQLAELAPQKAAPVWPGAESQPTGSSEAIPDTIPYFKLEQFVDIPTGDLSPIIKPSFDPLPPAAKPAEHLIEDVDIVTEEPIMVPLEAVQSVSDLAGTDRPENFKLNIDIIGENRFKGGEQKTITIMVCRGSMRKVVPRSEVMIKVLGSEFSPVVYHATTDANGLASAEIKFPQFQSGRASMIARAISDGEEVEVRVAVAHG